MWFSDEDIRLRVPGLIAILLSVQVVLCPFQCMPHCEPVESSESTTHLVCCETCDASFAVEAERPENSTPDSPHGCPCGDCMCQGALPVKDISDEYSVADLDCQVAEWFSLEIPRQINETAQSESNSFLLPFMTSAHDVRSVLSCWVI